MENIQIIDLTPDNIMDYGMCGYKNPKQETYRRKAEWIKKRFHDGLRYKVLARKGKKAFAGIEYLPAEYAWRPVNADGYMFIHCIYVMTKPMQKQGWGSQLLQECINDARSSGMHGVVTIARKGSFMATPDIFLKHGFEEVAAAAPDFSLLALKFDPDSPAPEFTETVDNVPEVYSDGLYILTSDQCPYSVKVVPEICAMAEHYDLTPNVVMMDRETDTRFLPCAYGSFTIIFNGEVIADHPISSRRFSNIMTKLLK